MKKTLLLTLAALAAMNANVASAALAPGDSAPALKLSKWVKGDAITALDPAKIYVVEFWATWCGPCKVSIPHLTELAHKFKDVTVIGVDVWENGDDKEATVNKFVKQMGDKMDYRVAMDSEDAFMADNWMKAAGQDGIPAAFIIQAGKIAWIGHPMSMEKALEQVVAGKFDLEKAKDRAAAEKKIEAFYRKAMKGGDEAELLKEAKELEALDAKLGGISPDGEKFDAQEVLKQAKFSAAMQAYQKALFVGGEAAETEKLETAARAAAKDSAPKDFNFDEFKKRMLESLNRSKDTQQAREIFEKYSEAVGENGDQEKAAGLAKQLGELKVKDAQLLNDFSWSILTDESIKQRDLPLATKLAKAAVEATDAKDAAILDTYARALFDSGKITDAVEIQTKAVAAAEDATLKSELEEALKKYESAAAAQKK
jgi:thiol-disulfide isomerase/thioredoxin